MEGLSNLCNDAGYRNDGLAVAVRKDHRAIGDSVAAGVGAHLLCG